MKNSCIVGGLFGLECDPDSGGTPPPFLTGRDIALVNARSGIRLVVDQLKPTQIWLPSYLCHTIIGAIDLTVTIIRYYEIDYDLKISSDRWLSEVVAGDLVVFIDYFGYPYDHEMGARAKERGALILEDASQALLSTHVGIDSDYLLFSLRKWIGVPDGGILRVPEKSLLSGIPLKTPDAIWWLKSFHATVLRHQFDSGLPTRDWFNLFREAEGENPTGYYAMSELSHVIFKNSINYLAIEKKRIENYQTLLENLKSYAIFPTIESGVVPLGFPVRFRNRDQIRQTLFDHEIYPPVHWQIAGIVPSRYTDSHRLSNNIMTIPCDQRYDRKDMERISKIVLKHAS